ncbi:AI-2E family transporter [Myceligenerans crystallogenes]|uniref:PurR-regulated permease PerM n=1 Tax=Myceligenerans crystallogenes TaxID=316335 RepID=A0ABN2NB41_9MICO
MSDNESPVVSAAAARETVPDRGVPVTPGTTPGVTSGTPASPSPSPSQSPSSVTTAGQDDATSVPRPIREAASWSWRILLIGAGLGAVGWLLGTLQSIVVPLAVALLLAVILTPLRQVLEERLRFPRGVASGVSLVGLILAVAALMTFAGQQLTTGFQDLSGQVVEGFNELAALLDERFNLRLQDYQQDLLAEVESQRDAIIAGALGAASTAGNLLVGGVIALFCAFFFLHDPRGIWGWVVGLLPAAARDKVHQAGRRGVVTLSAYARTQVLVAAVDAVGIGLGALFFVPSLALPIGVVVFISSFVPMVGAIVSGVVATVVVLVAQGWVAALIMLGIVILVQQIEAHVLQPFLMGQAVSLHPVAVILSVAVGSFVAGIAGALFAVPLAALLNTVVLYLNGHDKFPELGDDDKLPIRWRAPDAPPISLPRRGGRADDADREPAEGSS